MLERGVDPVIQSHEEKLTVVSCDILELFVASY